MHTSAVVVVSVVVVSVVVSVDVVVVVAVQVPHMTRQTSRIRRPITGSLHSCGLYLMAHTIGSPLPLQTPVVVVVVFVAVVV